MPKPDSLDCLRVKYTEAEQRAHTQMLDHYAKFHELQRELETSVHQNGEGKPITTLTLARESDVK
jgi:hypothetical protein